MSQQELAGIGGYNQRLDESKWQLDIPHIKEVPLLTN